MFSAQTASEILWGQGCAPLLRRFCGFKRFQLWTELGKGSSMWQIAVSVKNRKHYVIRLTCVELGVLFLLTLFNFGNLLPSCFLIPLPLLFCLTPLCSTNSWKIRTLCKSADRLLLLSCHQIRGSLAAKPVLPAGTPSFYLFFLNKAPPPSWTPETHPPPHPSLSTPTHFCPLWVTSLICLIY